MLMRKLGFAAITVALAVAYPAVAKNKNDLIKPRIVGGEAAQAGDYPWMSALVYTFDEISTSLSVSGVNYQSNPFTNSPSGDASGDLIDCGIGEQACAEATDKVCLIERGEINFSEKVDNCAAGGGVAAVIFNNVEGAISGTLGDDYSGTIPAVAISQQDGETLLANHLGDSATVSVSATTSLAQDSFCGASFIGGKWVLTAAHCVDDAALGFLKVNVGEHDLSDGAENAIAVERVYIHPDYDGNSLENDVALIELAEESSAKAIGLATKETTDNAAMTQSDSTVMGWGGRLGYAPGEGPTSDFPDVLHEVDVHLMTNEQCQTILNQSLFNGAGELSDTGITDVMICASVAGGGKSSCQGDSGGPLVIDTNEGIQQVGVVSWGYGCAADGFPGVFARVAEFEGWLNGIYQGIAIDQTLDFHVVATGLEYAGTVTVSNNSEQDVNVTFNVDNNDFTLTENQCTALTTGESCDLTVTYSGDVAELDTAEITITPDNSEIPASTAKLTARAISGSTDVESAIGSNADVQWYSGGEANWVANTVDGGIESGVITDNQDSIAMAIISGEGELTFEWAVSSEDNEEDPSEPFDTLYLYVNGVQVDYISGEVDFTEYTLALSDETNQVTWVYSKDPYTAEGDDKGYLRNLVFEPTAQPVTPTPTTPPTNNASSSGGGSLAWMLALLTLGLVRRNR